MLSLIAINHALLQNAEVGVRLREMDGGGI
jgi:hypothetical protein